MVSGSTASPCLRSIVLLRRDEAKAAEANEWKSTSTEQRAVGQQEQAALDPMNLASNRKTRCSDTMTLPHCVIPMGGAHNFIGTVAGKKLAEPCAQRANRRGGGHLPFPEVRACASAPTQCGSCGGCPPHLRLRNSPAAADHRAVERRAPGLKPQQKAASQDMPLIYAFQVCTWCFTTSSIAFVAQQKQAERNYNACISLC